MKNTNQVKISTICFYKINHHALLDENVVALNELTVSPPSPPARPEYANLEVAEETEEFEVQLHVTYKMWYCVPISPVLSIVPWCSILQKEVQSYGLI